MTIPLAVEAEILRLYHAEKWRKNTIATKLCVHHSVVSRVIAQEGQCHEPRQRPRMVEPYLPFLTEMLGRHPELSAARLFDMVKARGYPGRPSQFRAIVAELRPMRRAPEPYLRLKMLPGEQAQVDWGHFGRLTVGRASRPLMAFVMVFSYSRAIFLRFFLSQNQSSFLYGHQLGFEWFAGPTRICLYDNLKSVVLERIGKAIRFNPLFLKFAGHYRFEPRAAAVGRGNEKGRTERAIRYIRSNFFAARRFKDIDDLNQQALTWCETKALERRWPDDHRHTVGEMLEEERSKLLPLPENPFPCEERLEVTIGKSPYARFDRNDYSVPHDRVQKTLVVMASLDTVRILDGSQVVATHSRCYGKGQQHEDPRHIQALSAAKLAAGQHRRTDLLAHAVPSSQQFLQHLARQGQPLGRCTRKLEEFLHSYGAEALEAALAEALQSGAAHLHAIQHILERARREAGKPPALPLTLPNDPRLKNLTIKPHDLTAYDKIKDDDDDTEK